MSTDVGFVVQHTNTDGSRYGTLTTTHNKSISTPHICLYTRHGAIPHITHDIMADAQCSSVLRSVQALHISLSDVMSVQPPAKYYTQNTDHTIHNYLHLTPYALYMTPHDSLLYDHTAVNDSGVVVNSVHGKHRITSAEYNSYINKFKPDMVCTMSDPLTRTHTTTPATTTTTTDSQPPEHSRNRLRKCVDRNMQWLDDCIDGTASLTYKPIMLTNVSQVLQMPDDTRHHYINQLTTRNKLFHGYVLPRMRPPRAQSAEEQYTLIKQLDGSKLRVQACAGTVLDVLHAVHNGVDMLECTYPYSCTQLGFACTFAYTPTDEPRAHRINLQDKTYELDASPLLPGCTCYSCTHHTRAYIHHLLNVHELLSDILLQIHNLHHYVMFVQTVQQHVRNDTFQPYYTGMLKRLERTVD